MIKYSYFNPEVHSLVFDNFTICDANQCGGMCCMVLTKFYGGTLLGCDINNKSALKNSIRDKQVGIVFCDIYKSCDWSESLSAINDIIENIDRYHKPTLLYLDQKNWNLVKDHFVVAYAVESDESTGITKVYVYDPNYIYKRHFCHNDTMPEHVTNDYYTTFLEINSNDRTIKKEYENINILGFKAYGKEPTGLSIKNYTKEIDEIEHSCEITFIRTNAPEIINSIPVISCTVRVSKRGNIPADLVLKMSTSTNDRIILCEDGDNLFVESENIVSSSIKYRGLQFGSGHFEKEYKIYIKYEPSNLSRRTLTLTSNFIEQSVHWFIRVPRVTHLSGYVIGEPYNQIGWDTSMNGQLLSVQGLTENNIELVERAPESMLFPLSDNFTLVFYSPGRLPDDDGRRAYLGYIKEDMEVEIVVNDAYQDAKATMMFNEEDPLERNFIENKARFMIPRGNRALYDLNRTNYLSLNVTGQNITSRFSESIHIRQKYRCLIFATIEIPNLNQLYPALRNFMRIVVGNNWAEHIPRFEEGFRNNLERIKSNYKKLNEEYGVKNGLGNLNDKELYGQMLISRLEKTIDQSPYGKTFHKDVMLCFKQHSDYRNERISYLALKCSNFKEFNENITYLDEHVNSHIGIALLSKKSVNMALKEAIKSI